MRFCEGGASRRRRAVELKRLRDRAYHDAPGWRRAPRAASPPLQRPPRPATEGPARVWRPALTQTGMEGGAGVGAPGQQRALRECRTLTRRRESLGSASAAALRSASIERVLVARSASSDSKAAAQAGRRLGRIKAGRQAATAPLTGGRRRCIEAVAQARHVALVFAGLAQRRDVLRRSRVLYSGGSVRFSHR